MIFEKLHHIAIRHVFIFNSQELHWCSPNCFRLVMGQSRALILPKLCVIYAREYLLRRSLFHTLFSVCVGRNKQAGGMTNRAILHRSVTLYRSQWVVAIPSVVFFPDKTIEDNRGSDGKRAKTKTLNIAHLCCATNGLIRVFMPGVVYCIVLVKKCPLRLFNTVEIHCLLSN